MAFVREWARLHGDELLAKWERARATSAARTDRPAFRNIAGAMPELPPLVHVVAVTVGSRASPAI
ncbi:MAG: hypothetical protein JO168_23040 [Solirubrobacterales bacterium]|nr:hypothetical protein [Solirubrobacterales bacterium]MBV9714559.1 hypothetical protein [Solirubrobacterales bacterium]